jgi:hypothetical protein
MNASPASLFQEDTTTTLCTVSLACYYLAIQKLFICLAHFPEFWHERESLLMVRNNCKGFTCQNRDHIMMPNVQQLDNHKQLFIMYVIVDLCWLLGFSKIIQNCMKKNCFYVFLFNLQWSFMCVRKALQ